MLKFHRKYPALDGPPTWIADNLEYFLGCTRIANLPLNFLYEQTKELISYYAEKVNLSDDNTDEYNASLCCYDLGLAVAPSHEKPNDLICWGNVADTVQEHPVFEFMVFNQPVEFDKNHNVKNKYPVSSIVYKSAAKLHQVLAPLDWEQTYVVYSHRFVSKFTDEVTRGYTGITKQGWPSRWKQHVNAAKNGSPYLFHQAIRECTPDKYFHRHIVHGAGLSYEGAMNVEEELVAKNTLNALHPFGLNMIPGGFAGIRFLSQRGFTVTPKQWENRGSLIRDFNRYCTHAGKPNLILSMKWTSDDFASKMILANPNNLNRDQLTRIRTLGNFGMSSREIAGNMQIRNQRVSSVLGGKTYSRVK